MVQKLPPPHFSYVFKYKISFQNFIFASKTTPKYKKGVLARYMHVCLKFSMMKPCVVTISLSLSWSSHWQEYRQRLCLGQVCKSSVTVVRIWTHQLSLMWHTLLTSMEKQWVSVREQHRACTGRPGRARVSESLRVSGILLRAYIAQLFLTTRPLLITEFPPGPLRKHVWLLFLLTRGQIQTESKNDSIEALWPPVGKRRGGGGWRGERNVSQKRLARANGMTFTELALVLLQFQKTSNICKKKTKKQHRDGIDSPQHTSIGLPPRNIQKGFCSELAWLKLSWVSLLKITVTKQSCW